MTEKSTKIIPDTPIIPDWIGHRQRMYEKLLDNPSGTLTELELLELVLMHARPRIDVKPIAKQLLRRFLTLRNIIDATPEELAEVKGVKQATITLIKLIDAVAIQMVKPNKGKKAALNNWAQVLDFCKLNLSHKTREYLYVVYLDKNKRMITSDDFQKGLSDSVQLFPNDILKRCVILNADSVLLVHNHPSGVPFASHNDTKQTNELAQTLSSIRVGILDHLIIANNKVYSMTQQCFIDDL